MTSLPVLVKTTVRLSRRLLLSVSSLMLFSTPAFADARSDYLLHCSGCHLENGSSQISDVPDLRETLGFLASFEAGRAYLVRVPGASQAPLDDAALAQVMNYMLENFELKHSGSALFTEEDVTAHRQDSLYDPGTLRAVLLDDL